MVWMESKHRRRTPRTSRTANGRSSTANKSNGPFVSSRELCAATNRLLVLHLSVLKQRQKRGKRSIFSTTRTPRQQKLG